MKLNHRKAFTESAKDTKKFHSKVTALCFSEDNKRLAVSTIDRVITLFDDRGAVVDKFNTKANDNGPKDYLIR
jgi:intraflagellar transport protein 172